MKTAFDSFPDLFQNNTFMPFKNILSRIFILRVPEDLPNVQKYDIKKTVVVLDKASIYMSTKLLQMGFSHCLSGDRKDLNKEILAASCLLLEPAILTNNDTPFLFGNLIKKNKSVEGYEKMFFEALSSDDKTVMLQKLGEYIDRNPKLNSLRDLAMQISDELFTNSIYEATIKRHNMRSNVNIDRTDQVTLGKDKSVVFYAAYDDEIFLMGCLDSFGVLNKKDVVNHLAKVYATDKAVPTLSGGGAGLGLKLIIDNAANIYFYCEKGKRTIVACGCIIGSVRENLKATKHIHISIV